ncbi:MAG: zinc ribbon domain-containing protein [Gemmatimonadota bacterium]|nr:zinc ribbon domain-containing protein [Gemmatimonadota bacterium]
MMTMEVIAAALVALAVVAIISGPLGRGGHIQPTGVDDPEEMDDTPKGIALAALREIEFDKATGKLSDDDYASLKAKYTAEALVVLRNEAAAPRPAAASAAGTEVDAVEGLIAQRVRQLQGQAVKCPGCGPRPEGDAIFCSHCGRSLTIGGCGGCGAPLVPGSHFCEACGVAVGVGS